jgi:hypothetical protein
VLQADLDDDDRDDDDDTTFAQLVRRVEMLEAKLEGMEDDVRRTVWALPVIILLLSLGWWLFWR